MWSRKELKKRAKGALKRNYWKAVLVGLLLAVVVGTAGGASGFSSGLGSGMGSGAETDESYGYDFDSNDIGNGEYGIGEAEEFLDEYFNDGAGIRLAGFIMVLLLALFVIAGFILVIVILFSVFVGNPFIIGANRFFNKSLDEDGRVKEVAHTFDKGYKNGVKIMFLMDLYTALWSLLFVIPGIVKSYEYMMIPYILGDNPDISKDEAFALSKKMMDGYKWKAFVLDLSFIGWDILSAMTIGMVGIFYVNPYKAYTKAALYRKLSGTDIVEAVDVTDTVAVE